MQLGKYAEAMTFFDKSLAIESNDTKALDGKGLVLLNLGKNNEALGYFESFSHRI